MNHLLSIEAPVTQADKIFIQMRNAVVEGEITAGAKLSETELSTKYQVSRAIIREAINRLVGCHLVERKANVGARVVTLTEQGLAELYDIREALEGMAARLAAQNISQTALDKLELLLTQHQQDVKHGQSYYQEEGDLDFHYQIIMASNNSQLITILIDGLYHLIRMYRVQLGMSGPRVTTAFAEHQQIFLAIKNKDPELAELLMRRHITYSKNNIQPKLTEGE